ncbi:MAG: MerR family DNA-binding transcriptional regulator [Candidatus Omnitrophica bacterium]|nr:MerR family DNA-binding transcriptional regulator [Candidatus Omnitrophota bacterium]
MQGDYVTIKVAAEIFGVSPMTLRRWDKKGKLKALRHRFNNYRVYRKRDILSIRRSLARKRS